MLTNNIYVDKFLEATVRGKADGKLQAMTTTIVIIAIERFGEEKKAFGTPYAKNHRAVNIHNITQEMEALSRIHFWDRICNFFTPHLHDINNFQLIFMTTGVLVRILSEHLFTVQFTTSKPNCILDFYKQRLIGSKCTNVISPIQCCDKLLWFILLIYRAPKGRWTKKTNKHL